MRPISTFATRTITGLLLGLFFVSLFLWFPPIILSLLVFLLLAYIIFFEWTRLVTPDNLAFWLIMPLYPILPVTLIIILNQHPMYRILLLYLVMMVCVFDIGCYIIGKLVGKHKIAALISPGKTWEGFLGGYLCTLGFITLLLTLRDVHNSMLFLTIFTLVTCLLSLGGDLFESWLKRRARVKDSGIALPGHGGFLDRFDGLLFAVFLFYCWRDYLIKVF